MDPTSVINNERKLMNATCSDDTSIREGKGRGAPTNTDIIG